MVVSATAAEGKEKVVCVTGASGFIASWIVKLLLERGYTVNATVRDPDDAVKVRHLLALPGASERLRLFKSELMLEGSFDSAISGCQGVFHTATPVNFAVKNPQEDVLDPAVKGTLNVLGACTRTSSVRRVVMTSSLATILCNGVSRGPETVVDESWFSKPEYCKEFADMMWYLISKIQAEEAAFTFAKDNDIDFVTMNPGMVMGPMLQPAVNATVALISSLIDGTSEAYANVTLPWTHVKDVADAHIRAFEVPSAHGRNCLVGHVVHHSELVRLLHELFPSMQLPDKCADDGPLASTFHVSKAKAESLGVHYTPLKITLKETVESLLEKS